MSRWTLLLRSFTYHLRRLRVRYNRRDDIHVAIMSLCLFAHLLKTAYSWVLLGALGN